MWGHAKQVDSIGCVLCIIVFDFIFPFHGNYRKKVYWILNSLWILPRGGGEIELYGCECNNGKKGNISKGEGGMREYKNKKQQILL